MKLSFSQRLIPWFARQLDRRKPWQNSFYCPETKTLFAGDALVTWPRFEMGWQGLTEDYPQNVRSLQRLVKLFDERMWEIRAIASGHGADLHSQDGLGDLKRLVVEKVLQSPCRG